MSESYTALEKSAAEKMAVEQIIFCNDKNMTKEKNFNEKKLNSDIQKYL
jgi:hypothetical protein